MKNWILLLMACAAFIMTGSVKAQITVNSSQVEISKTAVCKVEALREVVELLREQLTSQNTPMNKVPQKGKSEKETGSEQAMLRQNMPNPFSESTLIEYTLPAKVKKASLNIYSNTGKLVCTYFLPTESRNGRITVESYSLTPGIYTYSLLVGNRIVDSKRMLVMK